MNVKVGLLSHQNGNPIQWAMNTTKNVKTDTLVTKNCEKQEEIE